MACLGALLQPPEAARSHGGFTGDVTYRGDFRPFWPWIAAGEWVHVGKGVTFGLGRYRAEIKYEHGGT